MVGECVEVGIYVVGDEWCVWGVVWSFVKGGCEECGGGGGGGGWFDEFGCGGGWWGEWGGEWVMCGVWICGCGVVVGEGGKIVVDGWVGGEECGEARRVKFERRAIVRIANVLCV